MTWAKPCTVRSIVQPSSNAVMLREQSQSQWPALCAAVTGPSEKVVPSVRSFTLSYMAVKMCKACTSSLFPSSGRAVLHADSKL